MSVDESFFKSNWFRVNDEDAYKALTERLGIDCHDTYDPSDKTHSLSGYEFNFYEDKECRKPFDDPQDAFAKELLPLLPKDVFFSLTEAGHEGTRNVWSSVMVAGNGSIHYMTSSDTETLLRREIMRGSPWLL